MPEEEESEDETGPEEESDGVDFGLDAGESADADIEVESVAAAEDGGLDIAADEPQEIAFDLSADSGAEEEPEPEAPKEEIAFELLSMEDAAPELAEPKSSKGKKKEDAGLSLEQSEAEGSGLGSLDLDFDLDDSAVAAPPPVKPEKAAKPAPKEQAAAKPAKKESPLDLDLGGLDLDGLDGLMPPAEEASKVDFSFSGLGDLSLEDAPPAKKEAAPGKKTAGSKSKRTDDALPDLTMEGLDDFAAPTLPPAASAAEKKLKPAAKTGTALDEFNIDLGDLLGGGGKKK